MVRRGATFAHRRATSLEVGLGEDAVFRPMHREDAQTMPRPRSGFGVTGQFAADRDGDVLLSALAMVWAMSMSTAGCSGS